MLGGGADRSLGGFRFLPQALDGRAGRGRFPLQVAEPVLLREAADFVVSRWSAGTLSLQCGNIRQILRSSDCSFVSDQCVSAKDEDGECPREYCRDFVGKRLIRRHSTDARQQTFVAGQFFIELAICFLSFREATKFSRCFLHAVTISLALTASEQI